MKVILKRMLVVFLSVIMAFSVFTMVPLTASAHDQDAQGVTKEKDITSECIVLGSSANMPSQDWDNILDGSNETVLTATDAEKAYVDVYVPQYYKAEGLNVECLSKITLEFGDTVSPETRSANVVLSESSNYIDWTVLKSSEEGISTGFEFVPEQKIDLSAMEYLRFEISDYTENSGEEQENRYPRIANIKIFADVSTVSVRALLKSHKVEWALPTSENLTNASDFTIKRRTENPGEDVGAWETVSLVADHFSYVTYNEYNYYTYLDALGEGTVDDFRYQVSKTSGGDVIGENLVFQDLGYESMRKNALLYVDYGTNGHTFDGQSPDQVLTVASGTLSPIRLEKLKKNTQGTLGISFATANVSETSAMDLVSFGTSNGTDKFLTLNHSRAGAGKVRGEFPGNLAFGTTNSASDVLLNDGVVHTLAISTTMASDVLVNKRGWHMQIDGGTYSFDADNSATSLMADTLTGVYLGGTPDASTELFNGKIFSFIISEEAYGHSELVVATNVRNSLVLSNLIDRTEAEKDTLFADDATKAAALEEALDYAKIILDKFNNGTADEEDCARQVEGLDDARNGQYVIRAFAGDGAKAVSLTINGEVIYDKEDTSVDKSDVLDKVMPVTGEEVSVTFKACGSSMVGADGEDLPFIGWYNRKGELVSESEEYTTTVTGLRALTAKYGGANGVPTADNIKEIPGTELTAKASASSSGSNGPVERAFSGRTNDFWMSDANDAGYASDENPVWIQTGFDEIKTIGAISYMPSYMSSTYRAPAFVGGRYNIKVSNDPDFTDYTIVASGTLTNIVTEQLILLPGQFDCQYVRLTFYSKQGSGTDNRVSATKLGIFEYVGNNSFDVNVELPDGTILGNLNISDANGEHHKYSSDLTEDELDQAIAATDYSAALDNIKEEYVFDYENYDSSTGTLNVDVQPQKYTVTAQVGGDTFTDTKEYGESYSGIIAAPAEGQDVSWVLTASQDDVVAVGKNFNYAATNNMEITAKYVTASDAPEVIPYISEPVYSRSGINHIIQIPVTLNNAVDMNGDKLDIVTDFGIVIVKPDTPVSEIKEYILNSAEPNKNVIKSSTGGKVTLTNKGRYLHTITTAYASRAQVYAYVVVNGDAVLSSPKEITDLASIPNESVIPTA